MKKHNDSTSSIKKKSGRDNNSTKPEKSNSNSQLIVINQDNMNYNNMLIINNESMQTISKDQMKEKCLKIFMNYSKFNQNDKTYYMNKQNLIKLLKDLNIIDNNKLKVSDIDIILKSVNNFETKILFEQFIDIFVHITKKLDYEAYKSNQKEAVRNLMVSMFDAFARMTEIVENFSYQQEDSVLSLNFSKAGSNNLIENFIKKYEMENNIIALINDIYCTIKEVYSVYFVLEISGMKEKNKVSANSLQGLTDFVKDFEIVPYLTNMNNLLVYWEYLISINSKELTKNKQKQDLIDEKNDLGKVFSLSKFTALLVYLGVYSFNKCNPLSLNTITDSGKYSL